MASVTLDGVGKVFDGGTRAVADLHLHIEDGEFIVFVGPSGCGKTTALRMVAGLEEVTEGEIRLGDKVVNDLEPRERDIAMVFQNYALYPHMTVADNIAFGLRRRKTEPAEIRTRVARIAGVLGIRDFLERKPRQLSGGQRQRVAMGRAIVRDPQVFLMDEPLSNLDAKLRVQMRAEVSRLQRELRATTIYVTHDQVEAMTMGDRVAVLNKGELQQVDTPERLFGAPANLFVAGFIGSPEMNLLHARVRRDEDVLVCEVGDQRLAIPRRLERELARHADREIAVGIRPEHLADAAFSGDVPPGRRLRGQVLVTEVLGSEVLVHFEMSGVSVSLAQAGGSPEEDDAVPVSSGRARLVARLDARSRPAPEQFFDAVLDPDDMHFFDLESGRAIPATQTR